MQLKTNWNVVLKLQKVHKSTGHFVTVDKFLIKYFFISKMDIQSNSALLFALIKLNIYWRNIDKKIYFKTNINFIKSLRDSQEQLAMSCLWQVIVFAACPCLNDRFEPCSTLCVNFDTIFFYVNATVSWGNNSRTKLQNIKSTL